MEGVWAVRNFFLSSGLDRASDEDSIENNLQDKLRQVKAGNMEAIILTTGYR